MAVPTAGAPPMAVLSIGQGTESKYKVWNQASLFAFAIIEWILGDCFR